MADIKCEQVKLVNKKQPSSQEDTIWVTRVNTQEVLEEVKHDKLANTIFNEMYSQIASRENTWRDGWCFGRILPYIVLEFEKNVVAIEELKEAVSTLIGIRLRFRGGFSSIFTGGCIKEYRKRFVVTMHAHDNNHDYIELSRLPEQGGTT